MNKTELVKAIAEKAELTQKQAEAALKAFEESVKETLVSGGDVRLVGFGTFGVSHYKARKGISPQADRKEIEIPAKNVPKFKPGKALKDALNK
ncbi:MAG: HU family DNA-binding protein [Firmicutes bacterium]|nr:HU family DNA-binding protein [Bacillota bacterium]